MTTPHPAAPTPSTSPTRSASTPWSGSATPPRTSVHTAITQTVAAGYDLLEISLHDSVNLDVETSTRGAVDGQRTRRSPARAGWRFDADVSSEDPAVVARGAALLRESLRSHPRPRRRPPHRRALQRARQGGAPAHAGGPGQRRGACCTSWPLRPPRLGMTLGLEICNRYETNVVNTARRLPAPGRRHRRRQRRDPPRHLPHEHRGGRLRPPGPRGRRPARLRPHRREPPRLPRLRAPRLRGFFHALADIGYTGPITFESFSSAVVAPGLSNDLAIWRNLWDDGADLARHAR